MNERIRQLAEQVDIYFTVDNKAVTIRSQKNTTNDLTNKDLEKFAELIVSECVAFLKHDLDDHFAAEQLQDHFEIEPEQDDETCPRCGDSWSGTSCGIPNCGWVTGVKDERTN